MGKCLNVMSITQNQDAFMTSTIISLPMLLLVKEEYRRSNLDTSWNDEPRQEDRNVTSTVADLFTMYDSCDT